MHLNSALLVKNLSQKAQQEGQVHKVSRVTLAPPQLHVKRIPGGAQPCTLLLQWCVEADSLPLENRLAIEWHNEDGPTGKESHITRLIRDRDNLEALYPTFLVRMEKLPILRRGRHCFVFLVDEREVHRLYVDVVTTEAAQPQEE